MSASDFPGGDKLSREEQEALSERWAQNPNVITLKRLLERHTEARRPSIARIEQLARESQAAADARRIAEMNARDERAWVVGLAILAVMAIVAFVLVGLGLTLSL